ncbi:MAG: SGNH/GDSL hydrolase family protein [Opitutus sp.]
MRSDLKFLPTGLAVILLAATLSLRVSAAPAVPSTAAPNPPAPAPAAAAPVEPALEWNDVTTWGLEGRAFNDAPRSRWFDRLPASAEGKVTDRVWELSRDSAGMMVRFKTDANRIWADYTLRKENLAGANMTAIGASGLDLYARDDSGKWRWVGVSRPAAKVVRQEIIKGLAPGLREYALYLPLYNGVENLSVGVPPGSKFERLAPRAEKPIVFYGTSITHGASASRPGMVHTAILGRRLDRPVINLGFSGNGRMDAAVGEYLITIDAAVFVIDCLPNMDPKQVREKCPPLVAQLRAAKPGIPIVLVEDRRHTNSWVLPALAQFHTDNHAALRECFDQLQKQGVTQLYYVRGDDLLGDDGEGATDGSHPNDLGFVRQADVFEPVLRTALGL